MTQNIKKKSRVEIDKEKFLEEKQKLNVTLLKIKNSDIKSQVFKFDMVIIINILHNLNYQIKFNL